MIKQKDATFKNQNKCFIKNNFKITKERIYRVLCSGVNEVIYSTLRKTVIQ